MTSVAIQIINVVSVQLTKYHIPFLTINKKKLKTKSKKTMHPHKNYYPLSHFYYCSTQVNRLTSRFSHFPTARRTISLKTVVQNNKLLILNKNIIIFSGVIING